jgi:hypothetical protein
MRRRIFALAATAVLILTMAVPGSAVTNGEFDGEDHPMVGMSVYFFLTDHDDDLDTPDVLEVSHRCSGTLISPTVYVTAGHCTFGMDKAMLWFAADVESDRPENGYPFFDDPANEYFDAWGAPGWTVTGDPHTFDEYDDNAFFLNDLGVVVLDEPVDLDEYGSLPTAGQFDDLKVGRTTTFTSVGYGLQLANGAFVVGERIRYRANPWLVQKDAPGFTGSFSFLLSNNAATGGTCFGDSGGPNFIGDSLTIAGITSYGLNLACGGTGGVWRLDRQDALDWVSSFLD